MLFTAYVNNNVVEYSHISEEYDYHLVLRNLNVDQANYLFNDAGAVFKNDAVFKIVRYEENVREVTRQKRYDMYMLFVNDVDVSEARFEESFLPTLTALSREGEVATRTYTPLLRFEKNQAKNLVTFVFITLALLAVSVFLLTALYNIRVNQYKFTYGVYMTFGADFKKLFGTAFWELFVISVMTLIPSVLLSALLVYFIYLPSGFGFRFSFLSFLTVLLFGTVVVLASVWMPMRLMSVRQPMTLIVTEDNSNLVSSPMRSVNLLGKKFPTQYEFYSIWRFRKYSVQLLTTAIVFCALFICGLYLGDIHTTKLEYPRPQFTVELDRTDILYGDGMSRQLYAMPGITEVQATNNNIEAIDLASHMITREENVLPFKNLVFFDSESYPQEDHLVTNDVVYYGMTEEQLQILEKYNCEGDLSSIHVASGTVIIGDAISNIRTFDFEVGDTIQIAVRTGSIAPVDNNLTGRNLLKEQIANYKFKYYTFTVGAILTDIPSDSMPIFFNTADYETITGRSPDTTTLNIYVDPSLTSAQTNALEQQLRDWGRDTGEVVITNTRQRNNDLIVEDKHYHELYICISVLLLCISPLVWFFTQTLYYFKREKEFNILQSLGASVREIRQIYLQGGSVMAILSLIVAIALSYLSSYGLFYVFNVLMPYFEKEYVRYEFYMPWYAILTSIVMSVGCGFFSAYLPFRAYIKSRYTLENGGAGDGEE
ncbi:MAG: FtsX-like permease family protein, partial [Clostridia bacterium]|nr:FtsX-like permease family protein [Clostridia bacterium]